MLIGASQFSAAAFASPANEGQDPRRLIVASFLAGGGFAAKLSMEYTLVASMGLGGDLDAPYVRRRRTGIFMRGIFGQGVALSVSPVMVTLDGGGGITSAVNYIPGWVRADLDAGGGIFAHANAHLHADCAAQAGGGFFARLSEYQKVRAQLAAGGGLGCLFSRKQYIEAVFAAGGGVRVSPWYDLIGEVDTVISMRPFVVVASIPRIKVACVSVIQNEDTIVLEVGI